MHSVFYDFEATEKHPLENDGHTTEAHNSHQAVLTRIPWLGNLRLALLILQCPGQQAGAQKDARAMTVQSEGHECKILYHQI